MRQYLKYWRDLPKEQKRIFMSKYKISVILYSDIKMIYEKENVKNVLK